MPALLLATTALYFNLAGGQTAGVQNVILRPRAVLGAEQDLKFAFAPQWLNQFSLSAVYGDAETGTGHSGSQVQEVRGEWRSLYNVYNKDQALKFNIGLLGSFAESLHNYTPYQAPTTEGNSYALEENEKLSSERLLGADFNFRLDYDRLHSDFHNVIYFYGDRIGPNLLGYQPIIGLDWRNRAALIGSADRPKLDFYTHLNFYFARKGAGTSLFNSHDGLGGTKREMDLSYGLAYHFDQKSQVYIEANSANNLNRGGSTSKPQDFRDGFLLGYRIEFKE